MAAYVILEVDEITDPDRYREYAALAPAAIAHYGGRYLVRGGTSVTLEGARRPARIVILEFDDVARATAWWHSGEYAPARAIRQGASVGSLTIVEGV
jgi:uncharacterized protein (DUF1330 family)